MDKKIKKAYKLIEKYEKKLAKEAEENDFRMYEDAGCWKCSAGQMIDSGRTDLDVTCYRRCDCANKYSKRYTKFKENRDKLMLEMNAKSFKELEDKWYDNNSHITVGNNAVDRSW